jgi:hypothetical protein
MQTSTNYTEEKGADVDSSLQQIAQSILDQSLKFGDVNQQIAMLAMLLYHKLLFTIRLDHC